jgi:hypothetical protein
MSPANWHLYFIKPIGMAGPVKIGIAIDLPRRLRELNRFSPFPLEVAFSMPGGHALEQNLHDCFADHLSHCEWFRPSERLTRLIADLLAGVPLSEAIDLSKRVGNVRADAHARQRVTLMKTLSQRAAA